MRPFCFLLESGLSENIQKNSLPVTTGNVSKNEKFLKNADSCVFDLKVNEFNMMIDLTEMKRNLYYFNFW